MKNSKVIIVDDEPDVLEGLQGWLAQDYETLCFNSAESLLQAIEDVNLVVGMPTCILLDFQMPGMNGIELQSALKQINAECPIIFMSGNAGQSDIIDAWRGGAVDFVLKPFTAHQVSEAVEKSLLRTQEVRAVATSTQDKTTINIPITPREAQVLLLLSKGYQQTEVAETLGLSLRTIKMYRTFLKNKLNLNTLMELARYCDQHQASIEKIAGAGTVEPS